MYVHISMEIPLQQNYPVEGRCLQLRTGPNNHLLSSTNTENVVSNSSITQQEYLLRQSKCCLWH